MSLTNYVWADGAFSRLSGFDGEFRRASSDGHLDMSSSDKKGPHLGLRSQSEG